MRSRSNALRLLAPLLWLAALQLSRIGAETIPARWTSGFELKNGDVIAFTGGANIVAAQESGHLESFISVAAADKTVRVVSLAWEGDTVFDQPRELNFPSWPKQLEQAGASIIIAQFGQTEALAGLGQLEAFRAAAESLLGIFNQHTRRIVLLSPIPFEKPEPPLPDLSTRNGDLARYVEVLRGLAQKNGWIFCDLFQTLPSHRKEPPNLTSNGLHLTDMGHGLVAQEIARQLRLAPRAGFPPIDRRTGAFAPAQWELMRQRIRSKNQLWAYYWRPSNWAFLAGDRTEQPSSRDHRDPKIRWFPAEREKFLPLIHSEEAKIRGLAEALAK
jgi:hypothetical protein